MRLFEVSLACVSVGVEERTVFCNVLFWGGKGKTIYTKAFHFQFLLNCRYEVCLLYSVLQTPERQKTGLSEI